MPSPLPSPPASVVYADAILTPPRRRPPAVSLPLSLPPSPQYRIDNAGPLLRAALGLEEESRPMVQWTRHASGDGRRYYHAPSTGRSSWHEPIGWDGLGPESQSIRHDPLHDEL